MMNYKLLIGLLMVLALVPFVAAQTNQGDTSFPFNESFLWITEVNVEVCNPGERCDDDDDVRHGDKISEEARPGATVEFDIEVTNVFDLLFPGDNQDIEIDDIEVTVTIEEIDDGDEIDQGADLDDLDPGDDDSVKIEFDVPIEVDEDDFDVIIEVDGDSPNGTQRARMELTLEVEKENNEVRITRFTVTPTEMQCSRTGTWDISLINTGSDDEDDTTLEVVQGELGIDFRDTFDLEEDPFDDDSKYRTSQRFTVDMDVPPSVYPIEARVTYDNGREVETETIDLVISRCTAVEPEEEEEETPSRDEEEEEEDDSVVVVRPPTQTPPTQPPVVVTPPQLPPTTEEEESLFRSNSFLTALIVGEVLLVIIAIVIIVAVMRKRD